MKAVRWFLVFVFLAVIPFVLASCGFRPSQTAIVPTTATTTVLSTSTAQPPTGTLKPTRTVQPPTPTEIIPTETPTQEPPNWLLDARPLPDWPDNAENVTWPDANLMKVRVYDKRESHLLYDIQTATLLPYQSTPEAFASLDVSYSPNRVYYVLCADPKEDKKGNLEYQGLQLHRTSDNKLISQVTNISVSSCFWQVSWSQNESILSFTSHKSDVTNDYFFYDVYAWRTNGSKPYKVGEGTWNEPGSWSPDASRLAVEILNFNYEIIGSDSIITLMYANGQSPLETKTLLGGHGFRGVSWLTNSITYEVNQCCTVCQFVDYFIAETGEKILELSWSECSDFMTVGVQTPQLSPNQRWFVVDKTKQSSLDPSLPFEFIYILYDFNIRQSFPLSQSDDILIDFVGWSGQTLYFVRRPINDRVAEAFDAPFGLIALDPETQQMRLVNPNIRFAWMSPGLSRLFALHKTEDQYTAAIYTLDGEPISQPVAITMPEHLPMETVPELDSQWNLPDEKGPIDWSWSPDGSRVAFRDGAGSLWLIGEKRDVQKAAENLSDPPYSLYDWSSMKRSNTTDLLWAPQSDYLVVRFGDQAWVISVK